MVPAGRCLAVDPQRRPGAVPDEATLAEHPHGVERWALDPRAADRLRELSLASTA